MENGPLKKLTIVIPAYNEEKTIQKVIERVKKADIGPLEREIIVVDDASKDKTREIVNGLSGVRLIAHEQNRGKGGAVKSGMRAATGDIVLIQDADLEYDPADFKKVIEPILSGQADAVMGSRFAYERPQYFFGTPKSPFFTHYIGNLTIIFLTNLLYGYSGTDYEGCYKAFKREIISRIPIEADGFEYDNELICKLLRLGRTIMEVPISYKPRSYEAGKKIKWVDGLRIIWTIIQWRVRPFQANDPEGR